MEMDRDKDGRKDVIAVPSDFKEELFRKSYIRKQHPEKFVPVIVPEVIPVNATNGQMREAAKKEEKTFDDFSDIEQYSNSKPQDGT